jgi:SH3 domain
MQGGNCDKSGKYVTGDKQGKTYKKHCNKKGTYKDNTLNRSLNRVGVKYGNKRCSKGYRKDRSKQKKGCIKSKRSQTSSQPPSQTSQTSPTTQTTQTTMEWWEEVVEFLFPTTMETEETTIMTQQPTTMETEEKTIVTQHPTTMEIEEMVKEIQHPTTMEIEEWNKEIQHPTTMETEETTIVTQHPTTMEIEEWNKDIQHPTTMEMEEIKKEVTKTTMDSEETKRETSKATKDIFTQMVEVFFPPSENIYNEKECPDPDYPVHCAHKGKPKLCVPKWEHDSNYPNDNFCNGTMSDALGIMQTVYKKDKKHYKKHINEHGVSYRVSYSYKYRSRVAIKDYESSDKNKLSYSKGDIIQIKRNPKNKNTYIGKNSSGESGIVDYENMMIAMYKALWDYDATDNDELSFKENDTISILEQQDDDWWVGINNRTRQIGMVPANYVEECDDEFCDDNDEDNDEETYSEDEESIEYKIKANIPLTNDELKAENLVYMAIKNTRGNKKTNKLLLRVGDIVSSVKYVDDKVWSGRVVKRVSDGEPIITAGNFSNEAVELTSIEEVQKLIAENEQKAKMSKKQDKRKKQKAIDEELARVANMDIGALLNKK